jgi:hypothetical protein
MLSFITLPNDWLNVVKATTGELAGDLMPVVLLVVGVSLAFFIVRAIVSFSR